MNDDPTLESMLRSLRPAPLPLDLRAALQSPTPSRRPLYRHIWGIAAAAAAFVLACLIFWPTSDQPAPAICIRHTESTLVHSRDLGMIERDGRLWNVQSQEWRDEELTSCSDSALRVSLVLTRHELVYSPVSFD